MTITLHQALAGATFGDLWNADNVGVLALALAAAYLLATGPLRGRFQGSRPPHRSQTVYFLLGCLALYLAVGSPLDLLSDHYLFSAHMVEHVLLLFAFPPLALAGTPAWLADALLGHGARRRLVRTLTRPAVALTIFIVVFSLWHFPGLYDLALTSDPVHLLEHAMFVLIGLIAWWPILSPLPDLPRLHESSRLIYLFLEEVLMTVPFAIITFAPTALYTFYAHAPRLWGITLIQDQAWGGFIMRVGSALSFGIAFANAFWVWARGEHGIDPIPAVPTRPMRMGERREVAGNLNQ